MEQQNCPGSWNNDPGDGLDIANKTFGDSVDVNDITSGTAELSVSATPFLPGKNVYAAEFVPSFVKPQSTLPDVRPDISSSKQDCHCLRLLVNCANCFGHAHRG